jgi:hypothetical protein
VRHDGVVEVLSWYFPERTEETHEKAQDKERYYYTKPLGIDLKKL